MTHPLAAPLSRPASRGAELIHVPAADVKFREGRINPEWVFSGEPRPTAAPLITTRDGCASANFWTCTAGRFEYHYQWDETLMVIEGEARVTDSQRTVTLRAGDVAHFNAGEACVWEVDKFVRKIAFHHRPARSAAKQFFAQTLRLQPLIALISLLVLPLLRVARR